MNSWSTQKFVKLLYKYAFIACCSNSRTQFGLLADQIGFQYPTDVDVDCGFGLVQRGDRKSTRLNSSHQIISYAVFCLKKKKETLIVNCRLNYSTCTTEGDHFLVH